MMKTVLLFIGLALTFSLSQTDVMAAAAADDRKAAVQQPAAAAPSPEIATKTVASYEYTGSSRRDPFTTLIQKKMKGKIKARTPLESYETTDMKMIAIMWANNKYYAVLSMPDGKSYTATEGVKVGPNGGSVKKISKDTMIIADKLKDARGRLSPKERVLKLRTEEE
jgi:Tfp pilus assembly protein PilP